MPRNHQRRRFLIIATTITAVVLLAFIISAMYNKQFITYSYALLGVYFAFFILYQIYDILKGQKN